MHDDTEWWLTVCDYKKLIDFFLHSSSFILHFHFLNFLIPESFSLLYFPVSWPQVSFKSDHSGPPNSNFFETNQKNSKKSLEPPLLAQSWPPKMRRNLLEPKMFVFETVEFSFLWSSYFNIWRTRFIRTTKTKNFSKKIAKPLQRGPRCTDEKFKSNCSFELLSWGSTAGKRFRFSSTYGVQLQTTQCSALGSTYALQCRAQWINMRTHANVRSFQLCTLPYRITIGGATLHDFLLWPDLDKQSKIQYQRLRTSRDWSVWSWSLSSRWRLHSFFLTNLSWPLHNLTSLPTQPETHYLFKCQNLAYLYWKSADCNQNSPGISEFSVTSANFNLPKNNDVTFKMIL